MMPALLNCKSNMFSERTRMEFVPRANDSNSRLPPHLDRVFTGIVNKRYRHVLLYYAVDSD
jgi:hypothetical protein